MGNALDFLKKKETCTKTKSKHNAICKDKIDKYLENNDTTKCDDFMLIEEGTLKNTWSVNKKHQYIGSINGVNSRIYKNRKRIMCPSCKEMFTPVHMQVEFNKDLAKGKEYELSTHCYTCRKSGTTYRNKLKKVGGIKIWNNLIGELLKTKEIKKETSLRVLFIEKSRRLLLGRGIITVTNQIESVIERARIKNKSIPRRLIHNEFDF